MLGGDLPLLKIFLKWCYLVRLQYILSKFHYNICRKGIEIVKNIWCLATCFLIKGGGDRHTCNMEGGGRTGACSWWEVILLHRFLFFARLVIGVSIYSFWNPDFSTTFLLYSYYLIDWFILFSSFYITLYNYCIYLFSIVIIILFNGKPVPPM